jgi:hypothetical protein
MSNWVLVMLLGLQAHFAASYLVPLDAPSQKEFGGLLRWFWPWADGDSGPLGRVTVTDGFPLPGFFLAMATATAFALAALTVVGVWVPSGWWRTLAVAGAVLLLCLMTLFFGPTKLIPMAFALVTLYIVLGKPALLGAA